MKDVSSTQRPYEAPKLTRHGRFSDLTMAVGATVHTDALFPSNTPFASLTFS